MSKRRYTKMVALLPVIEKMLETGMSHREIEDELGLLFTVTVTNIQYPSCENSSEYFGVATTTL